MRQIDFLLSNASPTVRSQRTGFRRLSGVLLPRYHSIIIIARKFKFIAFLILFTLPAASYALSWNELWRTSDQQGQTAFQQQQYEQAAKQFQQPDWKAAAHYRAGEYEQALAALKDNKTSDGFYNKGNAYTKQGNLQEALTAYQQALELDPDNEDAKYNKELIEKEMEKQQQQQAEKDDSQKQDQQKQENSQNHEQQDQENSSDQQQSQEQNAQQEDQQAENQQDAHNEQSAPSTRSSEQERQDNTDAANEQQSTAQAEQESTRQEAQAAEQLQTTEQAQDEAEQAIEQWLKRIPDDPAGLLKRKFAYQYKKRQRNSRNQGDPW